MPSYKKPEKEFLKAVGENIRYHRHEKSITLEQLGVDIGLDKSNMHRIEQGRNITLLTLLKIAVFLDLELKSCSRPTYTLPRSRWMRMWLGRNGGSNWVERVQGVVSLMSRESNES